MLTEARTADRHRRERTSCRSQRWARQARAPGPPEPGQWFDRYRRMVPFGPGTKVLLMQTLTAVVASVVIRRRRRRSPAHSLR